VVTPAEAEGAYSSDQGTATVSREGQTLSVQLPKRAGLVVLATTEENVHSAADGMTSCRFTKEADATGAVIITMTCNEFKGAKAAR
jgi:hypothetical protein